jgi:hypothetical protein
MYARWLIAAQSLAVAAVLYCANRADSAEYKGEFFGFDGPPETALRTIWRLRASESFLLLVALWVAALLLAYSRKRTANRDCAMAKYGPDFAIRAAVVIPVACALIGWVLGITRYLGSAPL